MNFLKEIIDFLKLRFYLIMTNKKIAFFNMFDNKLSESTQLKEQRSKAKGLGEVNKIKWFAVLSQDSKCCNFGIDVTLTFIGNIYV